MVSVFLLNPGGKKVVRRKGKTRKNKGTVRGAKRGWSVRRAKYGSTGGDRPETARAQREGFTVKELRRLKKSKPATFAKLPKAYRDLVLTPSQKAKASRTYKTQWREAQRKAKTRKNANRRPRSEDADPPRKRKHSGPAKKKWAAQKSARSSGSRNRSTYYDRVLQYGVGKPAADYYEKNDVPMENRDYFDSSYLYDRKLKGRSLDVGLGRSRRNPGSSKTKGEKKMAKSVRRRRKPRRRAAAAKPRRRKARRRRNPRATKASRSRAAKLGWARRKRAGSKRRKARRRNPSRRRRAPAKKRTSRRRRPAARRNPPKRRRRRRRAVAKRRPARRRRVARRNPARRKRRRVTRRRPASRRRRRTTRRRRNPSRSIMASIMAALPDKRDLIDVGILSASFLAMRHGGPWLFGKSEWTRKIDATVPFGSTALTTVAVTAGAILLRKPKIARRILLGGLMSIAVDLLERWVILKKGWLGEGVKAVVGQRATPLSDYVTYSPQGDYVTYSPQGDYLQFGGYPQMAPAIAQSQRITADAGAPWTSGMAMGEYEDMEGYYGVTAY